MGGDVIAEVLAERFRIDRPPTLLARRSSKARIGFSRMRSSYAMRGRSLTVPQEEAFAFHVPLSLPFFTKLWTAGRPRELPNFRLGTHSWLTCATIRSSVWILLSIHFAFTSLKLRSMRWPMKRVFGG